MLGRLVKNDERRVKRRPRGVFTIDWSHLILTNRSALTNHQVFLMSDPVTRVEANR